MKAPGKTPRLLRCAFHRARTLPPPSSLTARVNYDVGRDEGALLSSERNQPDEAWYALAVVPRKEKATAQFLRLKGYSDFLPMYSVKRRWSDRIKMIEMPLFPGYVFCRLDAKIRLPVLKMPTVVSILGLGSHPEPIPDDEIEALQTVCKSGIKAIPYPFLVKGAKVRINEGPLAGMEGLLVEEKEARLILSVTLLQRSVAVEVESAWIAPVRTYCRF